MGGKYAVGNDDVLAEAGRRGLEGDAVVVGVCGNASDDDVVASVEVERVVVVVVAVVDDCCGC